MSRKIFSFSTLTLLTALTLSGIAAWYSILGLIAIFAAAVIPIIVMGGALEVAKVVTTVWLHRYWDKATWRLKLYLVPAVIALAFLTSMGIFGFLSKAHSDQSMVSGDVLAKIAIYDEKIKIAKDNIEANRKALKQMDEAVDQTMARSTTETGAERAVQVRRAQAKERARLLAEIQAEQKTITKLNEERAPIAAEVRKVEAEVGPIKYIAALIYGDNPDANLLERAVRWVIILIVLVFDPLALTLVLAANSSKDWENATEEKIEHQPIEEPPQDLPEEVYEEYVDEEVPKTAPAAVDTDDFRLSDHPYLFRSTEGFKDQTPMVYRPETKDVIKFDDKCGSCGTELVDVPNIGPTCPNSDCDTNKPLTEEDWANEVPDNHLASTQLKTEGVTLPNPYEDLGNGYVIYDGKSISKDALLALKPDIFSVRADSSLPIKTNFGTHFPKHANKGDVFVRVDVLPNRVFKFDGRKWIEINKDSTDSYMYDEEYLNYLITKIDQGEYDVELLSENEKNQIEEYLRSRNT